MSTKTKPFASAFARPFSEDTSGEGYTADVAQDGLTKREYFAAAALTGLAHLVLGKNGPHALAPEAAAQNAVAYADALIAALNEGGES